VTLIRRFDWHDNAACADQQYSSNVFFPEEDDLEAIRFAKQICAYCPVRQQCLDHAISFGEGFGIWGGKTPRERRVMSNRAKHARYKSRQRNGVGKQA